MRVLGDHLFSSVFATEEDAARVDRTDVVKFGVGGFVNGLGEFGRSDSSVVDHAAVHVSILQLVGRRTGFSWASSHIQPAVDLYGLRNEALYALAIPNVALDEQTFASLLVNHLVCSFDILIFNMHLCNGL